MTKFWVVGCPFWYNHSYPFSKFGTDFLLNIGIFFIKRVKYGEKKRKNEKTDKLMLFERVKAFNKQAKTEILLLPI